MIFDRFSVIEVFVILDFLWYLFNYFMFYLKGFENRGTSSNIVYFVIYDKEVILFPEILRQSRGWVSSDFKKEMGWRL